MRALIFDRGTLRFDGAWDEGVLRALAAARYDPRCGHYRAPAYRHAELCARLCALAVPYDDGVAGRSLGAIDAGWRAIGLRPYQQAAVCAWSSRDQRGIVALPTGSGKTRIALAAAADARQATLFLVPTRVLMRQWREELRAHCAGHVGVWGDGERELAPLTVMTFESAYRNMATVGDRFGLIVIDEVHHFGTGARDELLEMSAAARRLGLTATPPRDEAVIQRLDDLVGPVAFSMSVRELAGSYLADFDVIEIPVDLDDDERREYDRDTSVFRSFYRGLPRAVTRSWKCFVSVAQQSVEGRIALAAWRRARRRVAFTRGKAAIVRELLRSHRDRRVLVFTGDNDTAYAVARSELIMPLTCDIHRAERDEALGRFRRGELRALVSARVLNEGVDVPDADVAIIVGASHGEREYVQRIGRLLRPAEGKRAVVYEIVAGGTSEAAAARRRRSALEPRAA